MQNTSASTDLHSLFPSSAAAVVAEQLGCRAAALCPVAACATGLVSVIQAANLIRHGECHTVITGSADASLHPGLLASYRRLGVLAKPGDDPGSACRPFDRHRSGFAVGEGAGILVLESWEQARRREATILAEWIDGSIGCDPSGLTQVDATGKTLAHLVERLLRQNQLTPQHVTVANLHGTATRLNDRTEAKALERVFGSSPTALNCFGLKGAIGHLMGAAGAVEMACSVLSLTEQVIPPTVNHLEADPQCRVNLRSTAQRRGPFDHLLKLSLGFGGHIAAGLLKRSDI